MAVQHWPERASTVLLTGLKCYNTGLSPSLLNRVMLQFLIALPDNLSQFILTFGACQVLILDLGLTHSLAISPYEQRWKILTLNRRPETPQQLFRKCFPAECLYLKISLISSSSLSHNLPLSLIHPLLSFCKALWQTL